MKVNKMNLFDEEIANNNGKIIGKIKHSKGRYIDINQLNKKFSEVMILFQSNRSINDTLL